MLTHTHTRGKRLKLSKTKSGYLGITEPCSLTREWHWKPMQHDTRDVQDTPLRVRTRCQRWNVNNARSGDRTHADHSSATSRDYIPLYLLSLMTRSDRRQEDTSYVQNRYDCWHSSEFLRNSFEDIFFLQILCSMLRVHNNNFYPIEFLDTRVIFTFKPFAILVQKDVQGVKKVW